MIEETQHISPYRLKHVVSCSSQRSCSSHHKLLLSKVNKSEVTVSWTQSVSAGENTVTWEAHQTLFHLPERELCKVGFDVTKQV